MFKTVFLLVIILTAVIFTPVVFGQDLKKATWLERASVIYDQKFSESVTSSVVFETLNNNEIQFPNPLLKEISSYEEVRFITFTNMGECVMGVKDDEQCIVISFDLNLLKGDGGIKIIQANGKAIGDELISDLNSVLGLNTEFHSIWIESEGSKSVMSEFTGGSGVASAVYTMPKQETSILFENFSEFLISQNIVNSGGFYDIAKQLANMPDSIITLAVISQQQNPMFMLKVSHEYKDTPIDISQIKPLEAFNVEELERSKYFQDLFVPLNSVFQVIIIPENPSKIDLVKSSIIQKLGSVEDVSEKGWFFSSTSYDKIDARFLFGSSKSVSSDELTMNIGSWDTQNGDKFPIESIQVAQDDIGQYVILSVIVVAAIGAAMFYLKGYKRNR